MEEQFETLNEAGEHTGLAPRSQVHRQGLWHRAANVLLFRSTGELIIQQRQHSKEVCPGLWDLSVAEHLKPGESFKQGAIRGLHEELSVPPIALEALGTPVKNRLNLPHLGIKDNEFQQSFRGVYDGNLSIEPSEILTTKTISVTELETAFAERPRDFTPWFLHNPAVANLLKRFDQAVESTSPGLGLPHNEDSTAIRYRRR